MADPEINNTVRAQCVWQGPSGLPEDRFVTTWAFARIADNVTADAQGQADEVAERLREFWLEPTSESSSLSRVVQHMPRDVTNQGLQIRCYDLGQAPPREPRVYDYEVVPTSTTAPLPREVAVTLSFYADRNLPRQRGRVFVGPWTVAAVAAGPTPRVLPELRTVLTAAAERLALGEGLADHMDWGVLSQRDAQIRPVTAGWCDDAFDTIRKRGAEPTTRTTWPAA